MFNGLFMSASLYIHVNRFFCARHLLYYQCLEFILLIGHEGEEKPSVGWQSIFVCLGEIYSAVDDGARRPTLGQVQYH